MPMPQDLPVIITVRWLAERMGDGWSPRRVRRFLDRCGCLERRAGMVYTTSERLRAAFPDLFQALIAREADDEED